ncbi:MAG: prepilin-type N-terminal cleavage/methylation domain-containing protein [Sedimentisphaerales bacterium]|nr:prepilin-type N-terminal cleavage/methylation domain-containing protein [Sedimentisphaerales bacterium]
MNRKKGFTLVELLIVVLILAALAAIAVPRMVASADTAKVNACKTNIALINTQIELYTANTGAAPASVAALLATPAYFPDGATGCECPFEVDYVMGTSGHVDISTHDHE